MTKHTFGKEFQAMREKTNLTQEQVSKILGYKSPQFISNIESGKAMPPIRKLHLMSTIYRVDVKRLVTRVTQAEEARKARILKETALSREKKLQIFKMAKAKQ